MGGIAQEQVANRRTGVIVRRLAEVSSKRVAGVAGALDERLRAAGFGKVPPCPLVEEGEAIYARSLDENGNPNGNSAYNVFVKKNGNGVRVMFSNPDVSQGAILLPASRLQAAKPLSKEAEVEVTMKLILETAAKKPIDLESALLHGHWGEINGVNLVAGNMDDGLSRDIGIIRQMLLYNYGYDGTGGHNHMPMELIGHVASLERIAGIEKIYSFELTMPFAPGGRNGPHHNVWFATPEAAAEYNEEILLKGRSGKYPPYAPLVSPEVILATNNEFRQQNLAAVGIAHPAGPTGLPGIGFFNRVQLLDYTLRYIMEYPKDNADGIAAFNLSNSPKDALEFKNPSERREILELLERWKMGRRFSPNALSMAFALEMRKLHGKFMYADHDIHMYGEIGYNRHIHPAGRMYTIINLNGLRQDGKKPAAADIVRLMRSQHAADRITPFVPYEMVGKGDGQTIDLVPSRKDTFLGKVRERCYEFFSYIKRVPTLLHDVWEGARSVIR